MKKKIIIAIIFIVLLTPIPLYLKDGGTVEYKALIYQITKVHRLVGDINYENGVIIEVLGMEIYNSVIKDSHQSFSAKQLSDMALEYFFKNTTDLLPKDEYHVDIDDKVISKYQNQNMVTIEIRHVNNNSNNTLDARYYINIYTAKGFDDLENAIDFNL